MIHDCRSTVGGHGGTFNVPECVVRPPTLSSFLLCIDPAEWPVNTFPPLCADGAFGGRFHTVAHTEASVCSLWLM